MQNAAKNKSLSPVSLAAVRVLLLLVVALCLAQTRVWGFAATHQPASVVFESVTPSSTGENYDGCPYDASDSLLADGRIATGVGNGVVLGDYYQPATGAQMLGQVLGQVALGFTPAGIAGDVRDATAAFGEVSNNGLGWRTGAGVAMAGVAFIPGAGDAVKGVVKGIVNAFPTATVIRTLPTPAPKLPDVETKWVDLGEVKSGITYGPLDALGRPTGITATITEGMIGSGSPAFSSIRPPGFLGGAAGQARGHLLGNQLGGSGADIRNLVTLQHNPANSPVMRGFENQIRSAVEGGQIFQGSFTPIYLGDNLIPRGITIIGEGSGGFDINVSILNPDGL